MGCCEDMKEALRLLALEVAKLSQNQNNNGQFVNYTEYRNNLEQLFDKFRPLEDGIVDVRKLQERVGSLENYRQMMDRALADAQKVNQLQQSDIKRILDALAQKANRSEIADFEKRAEANAAREALAARLQAQIAEARATAVAAQGTATSAKVDAAAAGVTAKGALGAAFAANKIAVGAAAGAAAAAGVAAGAAFNADKANSRVSELEEIIARLSADDQIIINLVQRVNNRVTRVEASINEAIAKSAEAKASADKALVSSESANRRALSAETVAKTAQDTGAIALSTAKTADRKADLALSLAGKSKIERIENPYNDAPIKGEIAQIRNISNQAKVIADEALVESKKSNPNLDRIEKLAMQASTKADQAITISKDSKSTATTASTKADQAITISKDSKSTATTASSKADNANKEAKESKVVAVTAGNKADNANKEIQQVKPVVPKVQVIEGTVVTISSQVSGFNSQLQTKVSKPEVNETFEQLAQRITNSFKFNDNLILNQFNKTQADIKATAINSQNIATQGRTIQTQTAEKLQQNQQELATIKKQITTIETQTVDKTDVQKITQQNNQTQTQINDLVGKLPGMIAISLLGIRPTVGGFTPEATEQMTTAAAAGTCRTTAPGGCTGKKFDQLQQGMDRNTQQLNQLSQAPALAGNVQNAAIQQSINSVQATANTINSKLGAAVPGGVSGFLQGMWNNLLIGQILTILTWWQTLHNAAMLSSDIFQTLLGGVDTILALFNIKKPGTDESINLGSIISSSIESLIKSAIGAQTYQEIKTKFDLFNRIYQAAFNIVNSIMNMLATLQHLLELAGSWTGQIGNALRNFLVVPINAYQEMAEKVQGGGRVAQMNKVFEGLEQAQNVTSTFSMITSDVSSTASEIQNIGNTIKETKDLVTAEKQKQTAKEAAENTASTSAHPTAEQTPEQD